MSNTSHVCPKCNKAMEKGALRASRMTKVATGGTNRIRWVAENGEAFRINAFRCPSCGFIEMSATERPGT